MQTNIIIFQTVDKVQQLLGFSTFRTVFLI